MPALLDDLRALFTGVPARDGWSTTPSYDVGLAVEICRRTNPSAEEQLRRELYDDTDPDEIPAGARAAITIGFQRWQTLRLLNRRGL